MVSSPHRFRFRLWPLRENGPEEILELFLCATDAYPLDIDNKRNRVRSGDSWEDTTNSTG